MLFRKIDITRNKTKYGVAGIVLKHWHIYLSINCVPNFITTTIPEGIKTLLKTRDIQSVKI